MTQAISSPFTSMAAGQAGIQRTPARKPASANTWGAMLLATLVSILTIVGEQSID